MMKMVMMSHCLDPDDISSNIYSYLLFIYYCFVLHAAVYVSLVNINKLSHSCILIFMYCIYCIDM